MLTKRKAIFGVKREKSGGVRLTCGARFFTSRILLDWGDVIALRNDLDRLIKEAAGLEYRFNNPLGGFLLWALIDKADEAGEVEAFYLAICTKMEINRRRNWSPMSNRAYHH